MTSILILKYFIFKYYKLEKKLLKYRLVDIYLNFKYGSYGKKRSSLLYLQDACFQAIDWYRSHILRDEILPRVPFNYGNLHMFTKFYKVTTSECYYSICWRHTVLNVRPEYYCFVDEWIKSQLLSRAFYCYSLQ